MGVRCKFRCVNVTKTESTKTVWESEEAERAREYRKSKQIPAYMWTIRFIPVSGTNADVDHESYKFWKWTPSGTFEFSTINEEAWVKFEISKEYYVDFSLAPDETNPIR